ncbi:hypothetical protein M501DRAFT_930408 [Patellaria atrata CBS 101060]|uniref:Peptidase S28 n=1 Tax=Patellaria atrata CBS 101060 TaxID=1346257 RepID=A0A9P4SEB8_9PEZI|nr:hypothetical protein M501DRAFT_930408 [Patellaria atrata CBS 101060]
MVGTRKYADLADLGLGPDGKPMLDSDAPEVDRAAFGFRTRQTTSPPDSTENIVQEFVTIPLDHFGNGAGTFENRFWVAESGYKPGGPVFIYDVGEANAENSALTRLKNGTSFFKQIVDQFGGIGIVWEHRFYGISTPEPINLQTQPKAFKYHNTMQALADVPYFARNFSRPNINADLTPGSTPWIFIGGSYPGMRAAFMRKFYPETIFASYASSAPVQASTDMSFYFEPVYRGLNHYGWGNCTSDIKAAIKYIDRAMLSPRKAAAIKRQFLGRGAENNSNAVFADALSTIFWYWQSYGVEYLLRDFCDHIATDPKTGKTSPAQGWAPSKGPEFVLQQWATWRDFATNVNDFLETNCEGQTRPDVNPALLPDCDLNRQFTDPASIAWTWQYCTEWGFLQSANLGPNQIVSSWNSLQHQKDICHRQFPTGRRSGLLPEWPRTAETNRKFGGWDIRPSNTYWSGGEFDPWRTLSPLSSEPFAPRVQEIQSIPACGATTSRNKIFGYNIANAQHCYDFRTTFAPGAVSRKYFTDALSQWLECFDGGDLGEYDRVRKTMRSS